jgi:hypothetical protein
MEEDDFPRLTPEENLLVAIFTQALKDALIDNHNPQPIKRSAKYYFENLDITDFGSFGHFCLHFNLNPIEAREKALSGRSLAILIRQGRIVQ